MDHHLFNYEHFDVRVVVLEEEAWFVGNDVAKILGYARPGDALSLHVEENDQKTLSYKAFGKTEYASVWKKNDYSNKTIINESGIYDLIFSSKLPSAKKFKRWVTSEVLPSIRKHGAYMTSNTIEQALTNPDFLIQLATNLKEEQQKRLAAEQKVIEQQPKVLFADSVAASKTSILVGEMAKLLKQNGVDIGANRFFEWLRENGYLIKRKGTDYNTPTQKAMDLELFEIKETVINHNDGHTSINKTSKITGKGQLYFINKFLNEGDLDG